MAHWPLLPAVPLCLLLLAASPAGGVEWTSDVEGALARAKAESRVVMIAVNAEGERACDTMVQDHYRDSLLGTLSRQTVNVFCSASERSRLPGVSASAQRLCEEQVREKILKVTADRWVVAPQHIFLSPAGEILVAVPGRLTKGELEWVWVHAIHRVQPDFAWTLSDRARAPRAVRLDGQVETKDQEQRPPTAKELEEIVDEVKRGGREFWRRVLRHGPTLLRADDSKVMDLVERTFVFAPPRQRVETLRGIADNSPASWWRVVLTQLDDKDDRVRIAAADTLGELGEDKAFAKLAACLQKRDEVDVVKGHALRAMAKLKPTDRSLIRTLDRTLSSSKNEQLRAHVVLAAASLEDRKAITDLLGRALADAAALVRKTAAFAIAVRRDEKLRPHLRMVVENERDEATKALIDAAEKAIGGGSLEAFASFPDFVDKSLEEDAGGDRRSRR